MRHIFNQLKSMSIMKLNMKKSFLLLAAAMMVFAAVSCKKDNKKVPVGPDPGPDPGGEVELIVIDGNFEDWDEAAGVVTVSMVPENAGWSQEDNQRIDALRTMKAVADANYIYLYLECDMDIEYQGGTSWDGSPLGKAFAGPLDIYFDADCATVLNEEGAEVPTGGIYWVFNPVGWEYLYESSSFFSATPGEVTEHAFDQFTGQNQTDIWSVSPPAKESVMQDGLVEAFTAREGSIVKAELRFVRAFMPKVTGDKLGIGALIQSTNWTLHGLLPQIKQETGNLVATEMLVIDLPPAE